MSGATIDSLAADAAAVDLSTAPPGPQPQQQQAAGPSPSLADATALVAILRPFLEMAIKYFRGANDEAWAALPAPVAALMDRYGWSMGDVMSNPWAQLALASLPLGMHAFSGWQADQPEKLPAPAPAPAVDGAPPPAAAMPTHAPMVLQRG